MTTTLSKPTSDLRYLYRSQRVVNVADPRFGTNPPDGTADNTAQIQAAILDATGGPIAAGITAGRYATASLYFPKGYWRFESRQRIVSMLNMHIFGDSSGGSFLCPMGTWADESMAFEMNGCYNSTMEDLTFFQAGGTSPTLDDVLCIDWDPTKASRSSTGNQFRNIQFRNIKWRNSALGIGVHSAGLQVDNTSYHDIDVGGAWDGSSTTMYQYGVHVGNGVHGNVLNHHFYNLTSSVCRYNLFVDCVGVVDVWGGSFGNAEADIKHIGSVVMSVNGLRSESSKRLLEQPGGSSYGMCVSLRDIQWNAIALNADSRIIKIGYGGALNINGLYVSGAAIDPHIHVDVPFNRLAIVTAGMLVETPVAELVTWSAGSAAHISGVHLGYCELASNSPSVVTGFYAFAS